MPAEALVAPPPGARPSSTRTDAPREASSYAIAQPMMPAPAMVTFTVAILVGGYWSPNSKRRTARYRKMAGCREHPAIEIDRGDLATGLPG